VIPPNRYATVVAILIAFAIAALAVRILSGIIHRLLGRLQMVDAANREAVHARARQLLRALTLLAYGIAALASVSLALSRFGINDGGWDPRTIGRWVATHGINTVLILAGAFAVTRAAGLAIEHMQFKLSRRRAATDQEWQRRAATLGGILSSTVTTVVGFVAILMLLRELSVDVVPILTGAGIAGLAIGFGAQYLVRDVIAGFFLILEDQVRVGDNARINGVAGTVEQINLRTIVLRDNDGAVQVFPNGTITNLANLSKLFAYAVVDLRVAYGESLDRVIGIAREVGASIEKDAAWSPQLLSPLEVVGIESFTDAGPLLRVKFKTQPLNQGKVANEMRGRLMTAFADAGIKPFARGIRPLSGTRDTSASNSTSRDEQSL
jgi:moderate conductance mechanosensitive channel